MLAVATIFTMDHSLLSNLFSPVLGTIPETASVAPPENNDKQDDDKVNSNVTNKPGAAKETFTAKTAGSKSNKISDDRVVG